MQLTLRQKLLLAVMVGSSALALTLASATHNEHIFAAVLGLVIASLVAVQVIAFRKMRPLLTAEGLNTVRQVQALLSLQTALHLDQPLPPLGGWAISPQDALALVSLIKEHRPRRVLELGSGSSSLVVGHALKAIGTGKSVALEHDEQYSRLCQANVREHHLQEIVQVVHAPLSDLNLQNGTWKWYEIAPLAEQKDIDLLIIDGPPGNIQKLSRYPAIPVLLSKLAYGAVVFVDDADRPDERKIVDLWLSEFQNLSRVVGSSTTADCVILRNSRIVDSNQDSRHLAHVGKERIGSALD